MLHLGYRPDVALRDPVISIAPDTPDIGERSEVSVSLTPEHDAPLIVDYVIDFMKANGSHAPKVFKLKTLKGRAGQKVNLTKTHHFKKGATTFTHYPGAHRIHLQVNGRIVASAPFTLS